MGDGSPESRNFMKMLDSSSLSLAQKSITPLMIDKRPKKSMMDNYYKAKKSLRNFSKS